LSAVLLFGAILAVMFPAGAWADGTAAGTVISNTATIEYVVGTTTLTVEDSTTTFLVDRVVDLTVSRTGEAYTTGTAGGTVVLTFTVTNTGNDTFDFNLEGVDLDGVADPYDDDGTDTLNEVTVEGIYVDSEEAGPVDDYVTGNYTYEESDTEESIDDLGQDERINVYMVCNVPDTAADGAIAVMLLRATALDSDGNEMAEDSGGDDTTIVQTVFADGNSDYASEDAARNAEAVAIDAFQVQAPSLTVTKTSEVQEDSINGEDNPMAIPSARVRYTIVIANGGSSEASGLVVTDAIPDNTWFFVGSITVDGETVDTTATTATATYSADGGENYTHTPVEGTDGEDQSVTDIRVELGTAVAAQGSATVTFDVIIQ
jgi:uncharacterized repeat protein (TIGR01451 family)